MDEGTPGPAPAGEEARALPYLYRAFGLTIASEIAFPELLPGEGEPDVRVVYGAVPEHLDAPVKTGVLFEAAKDNYLLRVDGVARYLARHGREVLVNRAEGAQDSDVRALLLGSVVTALLHQRNVLVLHAGGVVGRTGAVLIAGHSGQGKSTLLAALAERGYPIVADDEAAITFDSAGQPFVHPAYPRLKLWADAVSRLGRDPADMPRVRAKAGKYAFSVEPGFTQHQVPVAHLCVLERGDDSFPRVEPVSDSDGFTTVRQQTRNPRVLQGLGQLAEHFVLAARFAAQVPISRVARPRDGDTVAEIATLIQALLA